MDDRSLYQRPQGLDALDVIDTEPDEVTNEAFQAITQQLDQWISPRLSATPSSSGAGWTNVSTAKPFDYDDGEDDDDEEEYDDENVPRNRSSNYTPKTSKYGRNVNVMRDWWNQDLVGPASTTKVDHDDDDEEDKDGIAKLRVTRIPPSNSKTSASASATPHRPQVERAATPVMSNSSRRKSSASSSASVNLASSPLMRHVDDSFMEDTNEDMLSINVQSPWLQQQQQLLQQQQQDEEEEESSRQWESGMTGFSSSMTPRALASFRNEQYEYGRYHDAWLTFCKARRSLVVLGSGNTPTSTMAITTTTTSSNNNRLRDADLALLRTLQDVCWERDPSTPTTPTESSSQRDWISRREGNFWALLHQFRILGHHSHVVLWADDPASLMQYAQASAAFMNNQATQIHASPKQLIDDLSSTVAPLVLQRRKHVLEWLEYCMDQLLSAETKASVYMATRSNDTDDNDDDDNGYQRNPRPMDKVLRSCLSLILAGRLQDARMILRMEEQPMMAATLVGGAPLGYVQNIKIGNTNRALWKSQIWKLSKKKADSAKANAKGAPTPEEAAIYSLLANDYRNSMENTALRTWEKSLYALLHASWGRTEDEQLHLHNNRRRERRQPFPGTLYEDLEVAQLQATSPLSNVTERGILDMLAASSFEAMRGLENSCRPIAALLVGRSAMANFLLQEAEVLTHEDPDDRIPRLRFLTHLLLYLDTLEGAPFRFSLSELKANVLPLYLEHLSNHEHLWPFLVLYASFLPSDSMLDHVPVLLIRVEGEDNRRLVVEQAREFLDPGVDLDLLKIVVRSILAPNNQVDVDVDVDVDMAGTDNTPTQADIRKMRAIQWLGFYDEHAGDALVTANMLLRQFLLENKLSSAIMFLQDFLPIEVVEQAMSTTDAPYNADNVEEVAASEVYMAILGAARTEHKAIQSYLKAFRAVDEWRLVLESTPVSDTVVDDKIDTSTLTETEQSIAASMEKRELIRQKRKISLVIVEAAETARKSVMRVLLHEGGWLADSSSDTGFKDNSPEGRRRREEIENLRSRLLPYAVKLLYEVCEKTAAWMWNSLLDGMPAIGSTPKEVQEALDETFVWSTEEDANHRLSPLSPRFWTQHALDSVETIASDEFLVAQAFGASELKEMLAKLAEIALSDMMYSS